MSYCALLDRVLVTLTRFTLSCPNDRSCFSKEREQRVKVDVFADQGMKNYESCQLTLNPFLRCATWFPFTAPTPLCSVVTVFDIVAGHDKAQIVAMLRSG
jgi:hypothetical protein